MYHFDYPSTDYPPVSVNRHGVCVCVCVFDVVVCVCVCVSVYLCVCVLCESVCV